MHKPKVVVAGHICLDITPMFPVESGRAPGARSMSRSMSGSMTGSATETASPSGGSTSATIIVPGTLTRVEGVDIHAGGVVANTGLAMMLFGMDVQLMGKIGKDAFGSMILDLLREQAAIYDCSRDAHGNPHDAGDGMIVSDTSTTSYTIVIAPPNCDRMFLHDPGANDDFRLADLDFDTVHSSRLFHFGYPTLMTSMFRDNGRELIDMFRAVDSEGVITSLDLAAVDKGSEAASADWETIFRGLLPYVDFFMPSFEELASLVDRDAIDGLRERAGGDDLTDIISIEDDVAPLAEKAIAMGAKVVLIKCGAKGLYYRTAGDAAIHALAEKYRSRLAGITRAETVHADTAGANAQSRADTPSHANTSVRADASARTTAIPHADVTVPDSPFAGWANRAGFEKSYAPDRILSGTGAGDTTIAAFLSAMLRGYEFERCIRLAVATGASCVEAWDALGGLRSFAELERKIDGGWKKTW